MLVQIADSPQALGTFILKCTAGIKIKVKNYTIATCQLFDKIFVKDKCIQIKNYKAKMY